MKSIFAFTLFTFIASNVFSQSDYDEKKDIGFACGYAGRPTATVIKVTTLLKDKKYKHIAALLKGGHAGEKYLAVVSLEKLSSLGLYQFDDYEIERIEEIKKSDKEVSICSGCTRFEVIRLKDMFSEENFLDSKRWIEKTLNPDSKSSVQ